MQKLTESIEEECRKVAQRVVGKPGSATWNQLQDTAPIDYVEELPSHFIISEIEKQIKEAEKAHKA